MHKINKSLNIFIQDNGFYVLIICVLLILFVMGQWLLFINYLRIINTVRHGTMAFMNYLRIINTIRHGTCDMKTNQFCLTIEH